MIGLRRDEEAVKKNGKSEPIGHELSLPSWRGVECARSAHRASDGADEVGCIDPLLRAFPGALPPTTTVRGVSKIAVGERLVFRTERDLAELMRPPTVQIHTHAATRLLPGSMILWFARACDSALLTCVS